LLAGGVSLGCAGNAGAAGTYYDAVPRSLTICNHNLSTETDTLLLEFPKVPLWTNIYVQNQAKALFPLYWSRVQVIEKLSLLRLLKWNYELAVGKRSFCRLEKSEKCNISVTRARQK
jgi:hypothetical protein